MVIRINKLDAKDNNVNALYLVAHALHESDKGKSDLAKEHNNFWGLEPQSLQNNG
ncbi:glucosaminidase domain-containing protein [Legionella lytica]|uniref:Glucosaminidase domain-containing protein n=1 Tax=Legionella lytica TaxID=96232 RepID=A0ABY4YC55_9GAMM|nr:glucosaminidase domain-containing protein [Legionella lytica]